MNDEIDDALESYLKTPDESARLAIYELGRRALGNGVGLMAWAGAVHEAVSAAICRSKTESECLNVAADGNGFLLESLSAYEMSFQGAREANEALRRQNDMLEAETRRIAREIHDSASQLLVSAYMELHRLEDTDVAPSAARLTGLLDQIQLHLRRFAHELRPTVLDDLGLMPALQALAENLSSRGRIAVSVEGAIDGRLAPSIEIALYRTVQEALTNAIKHSGAAHAEIRVEQRDHQVRCTVTDDGVGFSSEPPVSGLGLVGLRERLAPLGGSIQWGSIPRACGAVIVATIPLETSYAPANPDR